MESYCLFLMGSFVALPAFRLRYGIPDGSGGFVLESSWQSALQVGGPLGALIGVFIAGPITSRIGYRYATILGLMLLNAMIFVMFFANSLPVFFVSQLLEGVPWGIFVSRPTVRYSQSQKEDR
jgi:SP family general alpha glucoside:H+ symporter-like MFS transporter